MKKENIIPVLEKAINMLTFLGRSDIGASQAEMESELDISRATCYRMIQTFCKYDFLRKESNARYDLSYGLSKAGEKLLKSTECFTLMQKPLDALCRKTGLSTKLSARKGEHEYVTMSRTEPSAPIAITGKIGAAFPIIEGSVGGVLLSTTEKSELHKLIKKTTEEIQERREPEIIYARIKECQNKGYCYCGKVNRWNIETVSAPVVSSSGKIFAVISLLGFETDFAGRHELLGTELLNAAKECNQILRDYKG